MLQCKPMLIFQVETLVSISDPSDGGGAGRKMVSLIVPGNTRQDPVETSSDQQRVTVVSQAHVADDDDTLTGQGKGPGSSLTITCSETSLTYVKKHTHG